MHKRILIIILLCLSGSASKAQYLDLNGTDWKINRAEDTYDPGTVIATPEYDDASWVPATVPGTVLTSYLGTGKWPDPNFGDNQLLIPDGFFTADFWYRKEFQLPESMAGKRIWLNLDGINWKAQIYLNGEWVESIKGAFKRTRKDVTRLLKTDRTNVLAVRIIRNDNPGEVTVQHLNDPDGNGGIIGLDSPTYLASIGWNWMPTIRGRNIGIWNDVYLNATDDVVIEDPFVRTFIPLPDTTRASVIIETTLKNHAGSPVNGFLDVAIDSLNFSVPVKIDGKKTAKIRITPEEYPQLQMSSPRLWWPNGYGGQNLYDLKLSFRILDKISDEKTVSFGIRQYSYSVTNDILRLSVNGVPVIARGGNWGMAESMLRCDSLGYDLRVRLHKEMNFNMIRNWIGMTGDDEFYQACDRYGIMIWDDFWLANPVDGPHPTDEMMFISCVDDKIRHFRNHPSVAVWCGRNEGYPPARLDSAMRRMASELDGSRYYISHSAASPVSGLGPYENKSPRWYFRNRGKTFHSEQGIVVPPTLEGMKAMMPEDKLWPVNDIWGTHDWTQERVQIYTDDMNRCYGTPDSIEDFCRKAQMMNMEACKALMEAWQSNRGPGALVWMSHPAWPSMICQTYDYFFEPTAAFFAFRTACEQIHIMWRPDNECVQVVNNTQRGMEGLRALIKVVAPDGSSVYESGHDLDLPAGTLVELERLDFSGAESDVCFIDLELTGPDGTVVSRNFYWRGKEYMNYLSMDSMQKVLPAVKVTKDESDGKVILNCHVANDSDVPAVMLRFIVLDRKTGERVLPIDYEDNFFSLIPGKNRQIQISFDRKSCLSGRYELYVEGWNVTRTKITNN